MLDSGVFGMDGGFKTLTVYQRSYTAAKAVYAMTDCFPEKERYGVIDQLRRASLSIPLNIAEGYGKKDSQAELKRYLRMSLGSANEVLVLLDFSKDTNYITPEKHQKAYQEYEEICKMLNAFVQKTNNKKI